MTDAERELQALSGDLTDAAALYRRGQLNLQLGRLGAALSDFNRAAALDPASPAGAAAQGVRNVLNFCDPDLYNP